MNEKLEAQAKEAGADGRFWHYMEIEQLIEDSKEQGRKEGMLTPLTEEEIKDLYDNHPFPLGYLAQTIKELIEAHNKKI